jgi:hypothetical protein
MFGISWPSLFMRTLAFQSGIAALPNLHSLFFFTSAGFIERTTIIQRALRSLDVPVAALILTKVHVHFLPTMRLLNTFLFTAASAVTALAQTPQIAFTSVPAVVVAGSSYNITWSGGDGISVSSKLSARSPFLFLELTCTSCSPSRSLCEKATRPTFRPSPP